MFEEIIEMLLAKISALEKENIEIKKELEEIKTAICWKPLKKDNF